MVIQIGTTAVLARLLTPGDFGLMAMAVTVTMIVDQFRTLGLSQAIVQREDLTWTQVNGLFWLNSALGVLLGVVVAVTGPLLAAFYGEPELRSICLVIGIGYLFAGVAVQHTALLNRHLRFRAIAVRQSLSRLLASVAGITAALLGAGIWALVVLQVSLPFFSAIVVWTAVAWRPGRPHAVGESLPLVRFGALVSAAGLMNTISRQADNVIIGKFLGTAPLGLYTRAYGLLMLPLRQLKDPVGAIVTPMLAALQNEPERYRALYKHAVGGLGIVGLPIVIVLAVAAEEIITLILGPQWTEAAPIFQLLAVASFFQVVSTTTGWLFISSGRVGPYTTWSAVSSVLTVASFLIGVRWGVNGVAAAYAIGQVLLMPVAFVAACHGTAVPVRDVAAALFRPVCVAAVVLAVSIGAHMATQPLPSVARLAVVLAAAALSWGACIAVWPSVRREAAELMTLVSKRRWGGPPPRHAARKRQT